MNLDELSDVFQQFFKDKNITPEEWKQILNQYTGDDYKKYVTCNTQTYARNYVINTELFDVLVLCWKPGQKTMLHGHPKDGCFVKILEWEITEILYDSEKQPLHTTTLKEGEVMYNHDSIGYHILENTTSENTISLHIYAPGNYKPCLI